MDDEYEFSTDRSAIPAIGVYGHQTAIEIMEGLPVTFTPGYGFELHDQFTGEIFTVATHRAGIAMRNACIQLGRFPNDLTVSNYRIYN